MATRIRLFACALAGLALLSAASDARAQGTVGHAGPGGDFGLGVVVGQPTGVTAELGLGGSGALNLAVGFDLLDEEDLYVHGVYKFYLAELVSGNPRLPLYLGLGAFVTDHGNTVIGARAPLGIALDFTSVPIHVFLEVALLVAIVDDPDADVGGAIGFHYFF